MALHAINQTKGKPKKKKREVPPKVKTMPRFENAAPKRKKR